MKALGFGSRALAIVAAVVLLAGCGGAQTGTSALSPASDAGQTRAHKAPGTYGDLLYVSDGLNDVRVLTIPDGELVQVLTDVTRPGIQCSDQDGNVFIADRNKVGRLVEFAHGGTSPTNILPLSTGDLAAGCAVDSTTGNVAVAAYDTRTYGGNVNVFSGGQGSPTVYTDPTIRFYDSCTYDHDGNLYIDGEDAASNFVLAVMPKGDDTFRNISLDTKIANATSLQWQGEYLTIAGVSREIHVLIYQVKVTGSSASVVNTTLLRRSIRWVQTWIEGGTIAGLYAIRPNDFHTRRAVGLWKFPLGGKPTKVISSSNFKPKARIAGLSISIAPSQE